MVGILASSLIEDVTIGFCALNSLEVIAPHTAIQISNRSKEQPGTFKRYDINYVLDTRLSGADDNDISLFVQLIHADSAEIIWAERYHLDKSQLMRRRRDLSRRIALSVVGRIENDEITRTYIERNAVAYHRYLVGRHYLNRLTLPNLRRARKELKAALEDGQDFAPVLGSLARTYSNKWLLTARGDVDLLKTASAYATRAIETRNDSADGHRELGLPIFLRVRSMKALALWNCRKP
jgi:TolB-like protein